MSTVISLTRAATVAVAGLVGTAASADTLQSQIPGGMGVIGTDNVGACRVDIIGGFIDDGRTSSPNGVKFMEQDSDACCAINTNTQSRIAQFVAAADAIARNQYGINGITAWGKVEQTNDCRRDGGGNDNDNDSPGGGSLGNGNNGNGGTTTLGYNLSTPLNRFDIA